MEALLVGALIGFTLALASAFSSKDKSDPKPKKRIEDIDEDEEFFMLMEMGLFDEDDE